MKKEFTTKEVAEELGLSDSRIRQLALSGEIDHHYFGRALVITQKGMDQARSRPDRRRNLPPRNFVKKAA